MNRLKVVSLFKDLIILGEGKKRIFIDCGIKFNDNVIVGSYHRQDCCEHHWLDFKNLELKDFEGLEFDLSNEKFFKRIPDYGIELIPINGHSVKIPGYGNNNGYYSTRLNLIVAKNDKLIAKYDTTECQHFKSWIN